MELIIIILLLATSLVGATFIIERGFALRWKKVVPPEVEAAVANCLQPTDLPMLRRTCEQNPSPLSRLLLLADKNRDWPREENVDGLQTRARYEVARLERGLVLLEIVVGIAPLLGLVGTIYGLIMIFGGMGDAALADSTYLSKGIATALHATLLGLLTAIPSVVAWSYYSKKVETLAVEMESLCDEFLRRQYRTGAATAKTVSKR